MPQTCGLALLLPLLQPGCPIGTTGAGRPRQVAPRSDVRRIEVHGACAHGAVPRTNASCVETSVTEVAVNPGGTGPPVGWDVTGPVLGGLLAGEAGEGACPLLAGAVPAPVPDVGVLALPVPPWEVAAGVPQPAVTAMMKMPAAPRAARGRR